MAPNRKAEVDEALADVDFDKNDYQIELNTTKGVIRLNLYADVAPGHCRNLIGLTKIGFYDGLIFHRVIKDFMIQGGCPLGTGTGDAGYRIDAEFNSKPHEPGVLSMARSSDPNSAGSQFFICLGKHNHLDEQYTAFGETADEESMSVVRTIGSAPTGRGDRPREDVCIESATVVVNAK